MNSNKPMDISFVSVIYSFSFTTDSGMEYKLSANQNSRYKNLRVKYVDAPS